MMQDSKIQLKTSSILNVPLDIYDLNFSFIVNGEEFKTSRIQSDLLSHIISYHHRNDPTMSTFIINTKYKGNFSYIIDLINFSPIFIPEKEIPFVLEVLNILKNDSIERFDLKFPSKNNSDLLKKYENYSDIFSSQISEEIETIAKNFCTFCESQKNELFELSYNTIERILSSSNLSLKDEDQLIDFVNDLYSKSDDDNRSEVSHFYSHVIFECVSASRIERFLQIFDINDINTEMWRSLSKRFYKMTNQTNNTINNTNNNTNNNRRFQIPSFIQPPPWGTTSNTLNLPSVWSLETNQNSTTPTTTITSQNTMNNDISTHNASRNSICVYKVNRNQSNTNYMGQISNSMRLAITNRILMPPPLQPNTMSTPNTDSQSYIINTESRRRVDATNLNNQRIFSPIRNDNFDGILRHLNNQHANSVTITSSSFIDMGHMPKNVVSYDGDISNFFESKDEVDSWICFDFGDLRIMPTHYQIASNLSVENHPKSWVIEGSDDGIMWTVIDMQQNCNFLNGSYCTHIFDIMNFESNDFRYIRMKQNGPNWANNNKLNIDSFELYGKLIHH